LGRDSFRRQVSGARRHAERGLPGDFQLQFSLSAAMMNGQGIVFMPRVWFGGGTRNSIPRSTSIATGWPVELETRDLQRNPAVRREPPSGSGLVMPFPGIGMGNQLVRAHDSLGIEVASGMWPCESKIGRVARQRDSRRTGTRCESWRELCRRGAVPAVLTVFESPLVAYRSLDRLKRHCAAFRFGVDRSGC